LTFDLRFAPPVTPVQTPDSQADRQTDCIKRLKMRSPRDGRMMFQIIAGQQSFILLNIGDIHLPFSSPKSNILSLCDCCCCRYTLCR